MTPAEFAARAAALDRADPLAAHLERFVPAPDVVAYLDGNSLGRPLVATVGRLERFARQDWGGRLIRGWDEDWMDAPYDVGDAIGRVIGAAPGQTVVADSTSVLLYKLIRAALALQPGRSRIVVDADNFPTDRFVLEGVAAETGHELQWLPVAADGGATRDAVEEIVGDDTALVVLSHVAYKSGHLADLAGVTAAAHLVDAPVLWDLCHSAGVAHVDFDASGADLAVGCTYKYLNGGPGSPAFAVVRRDLQERLSQPIQGWMGAADVFAMADSYRAGEGMRRFLSGTPPVLAMQPMRDMLELIESVGLDAIRAKSERLTAFTVDYADAVLADAGVLLASPRDAAERGGHVLLEHPDFARIVPELWRAGVIPDFRFPRGLRVGLSPLSTSFGELHAGLAAIAAAL